MSTLNRAKELHETIRKHRRYFHENAELDLDMPLASAYVKEQLSAMGYEPKDVGRCGVVALAGGKKTGKTVLLRADMDALPIDEQSDLSFRCKNGKMHACGHDFHASMLLGAAQILKEREDELCGTVKLMFQPGEETLAGARSMIDDGLLENPRVDAAMMIHVVSGMPVPSGTALFGETKSAGSDWFEIHIKGKGCHGAMANTGVDPLNILSHIHIALQAINSREVAPNEPLSLTVGEMTGGTVSNVIPDTGYMAGTIRTFTNETREFVQKRVTEIAEGIARTFRAEADVRFTRGCPPMVPNIELKNEIMAYTTAMLGEERVVDLSKTGAGQGGMGSEDFSYVTNAVPGFSATLSVGSSDEGYTYPLHHPKAAFDEEALPIGAAIYANAAIEWLRNNQ